MVHWQYEHTNNERRRHWCCCWCWCWCVRLCWCVCVCALSLVYIHTSVSLTLWQLFGSRIGWSCAVHTIGSFVFYLVRKIDAYLNFYLMFQSSQTKRYHIVLRISIFQFSRKRRVNSTTLHTLCAHCHLHIAYWERKKRKGNYTHNCSKVWVKERSHERHSSNTTAKLKSKEKNQPATPADTKRPTNKIKCVECSVSVNE